MQSLSNLEMVSRIETLLAVLHKYFSKSPKCYLELQELVELLEDKVRKILQNVKSRWISMLNSLKCVLTEYCTLLVKMYFVQFVKLAIIVARWTKELVADIKCWLTLDVVAPLLEVVKALVVLAQSPFMYACNFTRTLN